MRTSPGSASPGKRRCGGSPNILPTIATRLERLSAQGLVYPSFESRAEIARLVARAGGRGAVAARSRRRAALSRHGAIAFARRARAAASNRARPTRCGSTWRRRARAPATSTWTEHGEGPDGETGTVAARPGAWGDVILARKETPTSYHLSVVIDDALQGVTEVVRGQDLFWSTSVHRLLQALLGLPQPAYRHHRLVLDAAGRKLSKSTEATGLRELRAGGCDAGRNSPPGRPALNCPALPAVRLQREKRASA